MSDEIGLLFVLGAILMWGTWLVPLKKANVDAFFQTCFVTLGNFLLAMIVYLNSPTSASIPSIAFAVFAGIMWSLAGICALVAVKNLGLAKATMIWAPLQILIASLWGVLLWGEFIGISSSNLYFALLGIAVMCGGLVVASFTNEKTSIVNKQRGYFGVFIASVLWGSYLVPIKYATGDTMAIIAFMSLGMLVSAWAIAVFQKTKIIFSKNSAISMISGMMWGIGNYLSIFAVLALGLAKAFSLSQMALLVALFWGIFYFKEFKEKNSLLKIFLGAILIIIGAMMLATAKT